MNTKSFQYYSTNKYFKDKNVIVAGATGGIGSVLTKTLLALGAKVVAVIKDEKKFDTLFRSDLGKGNLQYEKFDFEVEINPKEKFSNIMYKLGGKLDILFLCQGKFDSSEIMETTLREYDTSVNVNTRSMMTMISLATPFLKVSKGNIVAISSLESFIPVKMSFLNTVNKCMVNMLIQSSALELASFGIRVNGVAPGITNTKLRVGITTEFGEVQNNQYLENMGMYNLLNQQVIEPSDVVETMLFLASDDAGFVTGEIIKIDNGYSLNHDLCFKKNP